MFLAQNYQVIFFGLLFLCVAFMSRYVISNKAFTSEEKPKEPSKDEKSEEKKEQSWLQYMMSWVSPVLNFLFGGLWHGFF